MRVVFFLCFLVCAFFCAKVMVAQSGGFQLYKIDNQLVVREVNKYYWQNKEQKVYLGELINIGANWSESNSNFINLERKLLKRSIELAEDEHRDSVFNLGFKLDGQIDAIGVRFLNDSAHTLYVGRSDDQVTSNNTNRIVESNLNSVNDLVAIIGDYCKFKTGNKPKIVAYRDTIEIETEPFQSTPYQDFEFKPAYVTVLRVEVEDSINHDFNFDLQFHSYPNDSEVISDFLPFLGLDRDEFFVRIFNGRLEHSYTTDLNDTWGILDFMPTQEDIDSMVNIFNRKPETRSDYQTFLYKSVFYSYSENSLKVSGKDFIEFLYEFNNTRNYFIETFYQGMLSEGVITGGNRFLYDLIRKKITSNNLELLYHKTSGFTKIFALDSSLYYWDYNSGFVEVLSGGINRSFADHILEEISVRIMDKLEFRLIQPPIYLNDSTVVTKFKEEQFSVVSMKNAENILSHFYIIGWEQIEDKDQLLNFLAVNEIDNRVPIEIYAVGHKIVLVTPLDGEFIFSLWNSEEGSNTELARINKVLTSNQREILLRAIVDQFQISEDPNTCQPSIYALEDCADNELILSFENEEANNLHLLKKTSDGIIDLYSEHNHRPENNSFYSALLKMLDADQVLNIDKESGQVFALDSKGRIWSMINGNLENILQLNDPSLAIDDVRPYLNVLLNNYQRNPIKAQVNINEDYDYAFIKYGATQTTGLIDRNLDSKVLVEINNIEEFDETQPEFIRNLLDEISISDFQSVDIIGKPEESTWLTRIDDSYYLSGVSEQKLVYLGDGYDVLAENRSNRNVLDKYLFGLYEKQWNIELSNISFRDSKWIYGFKRTPNAINTLNTLTNHRMTFDGELTQEDYLSTVSLFDELQIDFEERDTVFSQKRGEVIVSSSADQIALWTTTASEVHLPAPSFPEAEDGLYFQLVNELIKDYKEDPNFEVIPLGMDSKGETYALYLEEGQTLELLSKEKYDQPLVLKDIAFNEVNDNLLQALNTNSDSKIAYYRLLSIDNYAFLLSDRNDIIRLDDLSKPDWESIGNLNDLKTETQKGFTQALLKEFAGNQSIMQIPEFTFFNLDKTQTGLWRVEDAFSTFIYDQSSSTSSLIDQNIHQDLIWRDSTLVDKFFYDAKNSNESDIFSSLIWSKESQSDFRSYFNQTENTWTIEFNDATMKSLMIEEDDFNRVKHDTQIDIDESSILVLIASVKGFEIGSGKIQYGQRGFYFTYNSSSNDKTLLFYRKGETTASCKKVENIIENDIRIPDASISKLGQGTNYEAILNLLLNDYLIQYDSWPEIREFWREEYGLIPDTHYRIHVMGGTCSMN